MHLKILNEVAFHDPAYAREVAERNARFESTKQAFNNVTKFWNQFSPNISDVSKGDGGQLYLKGFRILQFGKYNFLINKDDNDRLLNAYGNGEDKQSFLNTALDILHNKYHYDTSSVEASIKNDNLKFPNSTPELYNSTGIDLSRNTYNAIMSYPKYYAIQGGLALVGGPFSIVTKGLSTALKALDYTNIGLQVIAKANAGSPEEDKLIGIRNIDFDAYKPEDRESIYGLLVQMKDQGSLTDDSLEVLKNLEDLNSYYVDRNTSPHMNYLIGYEPKEETPVTSDVDKFIKTEQSADHQQALEIEKEHRAKLSANYKKNVIDKATTENPKPEPDGDNKAQEFLNDYPKLKETLGWFGESPLNLSVGVLGTILVGYGLYKAYNAWKAYRANNKNAADKLMKQEKLPKNQQEANSIVKRGKL